MNNEELSKMRKIIKLTLIKIGIRCDLVGFSYLCYAIELVIINPELIHSLCKNLYSKISEKFQISKENCVERSIRHAIEYTYLNKSFCELNKLFNFQLYAIDDKPTAGELIRLVAEYYTLGLYEKAAA